MGREKKLIQAWKSFTRLSENSRCVIVMTILLLLPKVAKGK